ncbi:MAG TPA: hypothetical protein DEP47_09170 [Chloroflexi bacterium]|nr:hypothetical protein [Chloroflexota bacterium]
MSGDWLQLTEEDIARAHQLAKDRPPMPEVITITSDDIDIGQPVVASSNDIITITMDDLAPEAPITTTTVDLQQLEQLMFDLLNRSREEHLPRWLGTARLRWHASLAAAARGHSADMLRRQYVAHATPEGVTAAQRINNQRIRYVACGENIGVFYGEAAGTSRAVTDIHTAFMNQPRSLTNHRGNLLNPIWTHVGIGIAHNPEGSLVATQNFISAPGSRLRGR